MERRLGVEEDYFVIIDEQEPGKYHGHIAYWNELTHDMKNALYEAGIVKNITTGKR